MKCVITTISCENTGREAVLWCDCAARPHGRQLAACKVAFLDKILASVGIFIVRASVQKQWKTIAGSGHAPAPINRFASSLNFYLIAFLCI